MTKPRSGRLSIIPAAVTGGRPMNVIILPRTTAGRKLLRGTLPFSHDPNRRDGELPDGSSIYGTDFDELAVKVERDYDDYRAWRKERERGGV